MQPKFWKNKNLLAILLWPLSLLYSAVTSVRGLKAKKYKATVPVICVGNVTVGGAGKTPVVLSISELLKADGMKVAIASRGYKGNITVPTLVDKNRHTVNSVGDEPLMLARIAPTYIAAKRNLAIQMAENNGANIVIMDDGLQNPFVVKDISILVIDGKYGIGNGFVMPAGPLRESLASGVSKADAVIIVGNDDMCVINHPALSAKSAPPVIRAKLKPFGDLPEKNKPYIAFAGIGNPDKFFSTLIENGYNIVESIPFSDHHNYSDAEINNLIHKAEDGGYELITTEKDQVRLPLFSRNKIRILPVKIVWDDVTQIYNILMRKLKK